MRVELGTAGIKDKTKKIFRSFLEEIAKNTSSISFDVWIKTLEIVDIKENVLVLSTPTSSSKTVLQKKYKSLVIKSANKIYSAISDVEFIVKSNEEETEEVFEAVEEIAE